MLFYRFDVTTGRPITAFGSVGAAISPIVRTAEAVQIGCIHLAPGGGVGHHPAVGPQLFLVVAGEGWVRGEEADRYLIRAGQAAFWRDGEGHESGTAAGMTAIVVEGPGLDPAPSMVELSKDEVERM
jgi:quercetin dioxygenase-like cupin family protein